MYIKSQVKGKASEQKRKITVDSEEVAIYIRSTARNQAFLGKVSI